MTADVFQVTKTIGEEKPQNIPAKEMEKQSIDTRIPSTEQKRIEDHDNDYEEEKDEKQVAEMDRLKNMEHEKKQPICDTWCRPRQNRMTFQYSMSC